MISLAISPCVVSAYSATQFQPQSVKPSKLRRGQLGLLISKVRIRHFLTHCTNLTPLDSSQITYSPIEEYDGNLLEGSPEMIATVDCGNTIPALTTNIERAVESTNKPVEGLYFLKPLMWFLGPAILLTTSVVPSLWLPISEIYVKPSIASLLALIGLDCIFNLGATLFLLLADSCARSEDSRNSYKSKAPFSYKMSNMVASVTGFIIPLALLFGSHKGFPQPQLFSILLGPYLLLLLVQILTEFLTWHWQSPVWLVTPIVYEAYRVLQLMRGLKLSAELSMPELVVHGIRGLVCWWVLILGLQLMRVVWFAGSRVEVRQQQQ